MSGRDLNASVRQRLLNQARSQGLAMAPFADRFILKGALLLTAWRWAHRIP